jgi:hypothetical protein
MLSPWSGRREGRRSITASGFNPGEVVDIRIQGGAVQHVTADDAGSATVAVESASLMTEPLTVEAQSSVTDLGVVMALSAPNFTGWFTVVDNVTGQNGASLSVARL